MSEINKFQPEIKPFFKQNYHFIFHGGIYRIDSIIKDRAIILYSGTKWKPNRMRKVRQSTWNRFTETTIMNYGLGIDPDLATEVINGWRFEEQYLYEN